MAIITEDIHKHYGQIKAVNGVTTTVPDGTIFGLLGPNGAGKTTLVRLLTTLSHPTSGKAWINDLDIATQGLQIRRQIGVMAQENYLDTYLTGRENLVVHAKMHGMRRNEYEPRIDSLLKMMKLEGRQNDSPRTYSGGMQRRLALARALIHNPRVLFLDEPTTGLDPQARRAVWDYLFELKGKVTIFLTTHYMEEADILCDRVAIMDHGQILVDDSPQALKRSLNAYNSYEIELRSASEKYIATLHSLPFVTSCAAEDGRIVVQTTPETSVRTLIDFFDERDIARFTVREPGLEDVFIHLTGRSLRE